MKTTYTTAQRYTALIYGLVSFALFVTSVVVMMVSLYHGLSTGFVSLSGVSAWAVNVLLLMQFALGHSWLLSEKGRRFMTKLAPLGLGKPLSTTIFAGLASIQLLNNGPIWRS